MSLATAWSEGTEEPRAAGQGLGRGWLLVEQGQMWQELQALLFFGISRKGWRSESESESPALPGQGQPRAGPVPWLWDPCPAHLPGWKQWWLEVW